MYAEFGDFECLLGYWLPNEPSKRVKVGINFGVNPKSPISKAVTAAFRDFVRVKKGPWQLSSENDWCCIFKEQDLQDFAAHTDQIKAIKDYFLSLLVEVKEFKESYPKLPWTVKETERDEDGG